MFTDWKDLVPKIAERSGYTEEEVTLQIEKYAKSLEESLNTYDHWRHDFFRIGYINLPIRFLRMMLGKMNPKGLIPLEKVFGLYKQALSRREDKYEKEIARLPEVRKRLDESGINTNEVSPFVQTFKRLDRGSHSVGGNDFVEGNDFEAREVTEED